MKSEKIFDNAKIDKIDENCKKINNLKISKGPLNTLGERKEKMFIYFEEIMKIILNSNLKELREIKIVLKAHQIIYNEEYNAYGSLRSSISKLEKLEKLGVEKPKDLLLDNPFAFHEEIKKYYQEYF